MPFTYTTPPPRVLVVEDDEKLAILLCRAFRDDGLLAEPVYDGVTALDRLCAEPFAAVLLDVGPPGLSGLEVCARLRRNGSTIPVIMLSARDGADDVVAGRRAGATDYFVKPFSLRDLAARLDDLVRAGGDPRGQLFTRARLVHPVEPSVIHPTKQQASLASWRARARTAT